MRRLPILLAAIFLSACAATAPPPVSDPAIPPPAGFEHIPLFEKGEGMEPPKVLERVEPRASRELRQSVMKASATVELVIDETGKVAAAWYVDGHREWAKALLAAVRQWRFQPATRDGQPIAVRSRITSTLRSGL